MTWLEWGGVAFALVCLGVFLFVGMARTRAELRWIDEKQRELDRIELELGIHRKKRRGR
jgi:hypothetical protein